MTRISSTEKGDLFEAKAAEMVEEAIASGQFGIDPSSCRVFRKKKYYSKDREDNIIFDISVEVWPPNANNYILLYLIECKSYAHRVPVNDVEEFYAKIIQVGGVNVKGVFITDNELQDGALKYVRSKGMMYIKVNGAQYDIVYHKIDRFSDHYQIYDGREVIEDYEDKLDSLLVDVFSDDNEKIYGTENLSAKQIAEIAENILLSINEEVFVNYISLDIKDVMIYMSNEYGVEFFINEEIIYSKNGSKILGNVDLIGKKIYVAKEILCSKRFSFVVAHEIGHFLLHRKLKIKQKSYDSFQDSEYDFTIGKYRLSNMKNWIEWQANCFAASLLMPDRIVLAYLVYCQKQIGIAKNIGKIFLDDQMVNKDDYHKILNYLSVVFGVSKTTMKYKLESMGVIIHARNYGENTRPTLAYGSVFDEYDVY